MDVCNWFLEIVCYFCNLGMEVFSVEEDGVCVCLFWCEDLVGNLDIGVLYGGVIFVMMDQVGGMVNSCCLYFNFEIMLIIDFCVDYLYVLILGKVVICYVSCYWFMFNVIFVWLIIWEEGEEVGELVVIGLVIYICMKLDKNGWVVF